MNHIPFRVAQILQKKRDYAVLDEFIEGYVRGLMACSVKVVEEKIDTIAHTSSRLLVALHKKPQNIF